MANVAQWLKNGMTLIRPLKKVQIFILVPIDSLYATSIGVVVTFSLGRTV